MTDASRIDKSQKNLDAHNAEWDRRAKAMTNGICVGCDTPTPLTVKPLRTEKPAKANKPAQKSRLVRTSGQR